MKLRQHRFGARDCVPQRFRAHEGRTPVPTAAGHRPALRAFTLVELIVVMALLVTVMAVASPSLAGFFRGRAVDAEARRLMSLTRLGQSRAAGEGIPMILWVDLNQPSYGLEADSSFVDEDTKAVEYPLDSNVTLEIGATDDASGAITANTLFGTATSASRHASLPNIRFEPDGSISGSSPESFRMMDRDGGSLWVGQSANRMSYEIRNQATQRVRQKR
jgi:prepilin-type N-terminal cleavage/methylation domain-containing protein